MRGFIEEGTTTTPFDMAVMNELDRYHLAIEAINRLPVLKEKAAHVVSALQEKLTQHKIFVCEHGEDMPEIQNWKWPYPKP
ncbi:Xylulose-5-phosphate phosphoketolase [compost metagenome]